MGAATVTYGATVTFLALYGGQRGIANVGPFFTAYAAVMLLTRPFIGRLIDRRGREIVVLPGAVLITAALLLLSRSSSLGGFLLCAALYGLGQGCIHVSTQTMAVLAAPRHRIGAANATFFTGFDAGIGSGAILAGFLSSALGYSGMFAVLSAFPLLAGVLFLAFRKRFASGKD
jgi:MFS family permease